MELVQPSSALVLWRKAAVWLLVHCMTTCWRTSQHACYTAPSALLQHSFLQAARVPGTLLALVCWRVGRRLRCSGGDSIRRPMLLLRYVISVMACVACGAAALLGVMSKLVSTHVPAGAVLPAQVDAVRALRTV
jgi:hypothetical protein